MITFILILSILILVHELGHFIAAKQLKVKVEKFSLGFGPKILSKKIGDTEYMLCAIPFGGFIKMAGDSTEEFKGKEDEFLSRKPGHRARIIFAGPFFNYILAFLCLWMVFYFGYPRYSTKIGELINGLPAQAAGMMVGDKILEIDGKAVEFWEDISKTIHAKRSETIVVKALRGGSEINFTMIPEGKKVDTVFGKKVEVGLIGIKPSDEIIKIRYGLFDSLVKGTQNLIAMTSMTIVAILNIITGTMSFKESVTGPLGIFFIASGAAKLGISAVLHVIGILSMSLAIFNLLPLPILDGGHIFLAGLEKIRKRPLTPKIEDILGNVGMSFLIILAIFIFGNDIIRYGYWDKFLALFGK